MARRRGERWVSIRTDVIDPQFRTWELSDAAYRLYVGSIPRGSRTMPASRG